MEVWKSDGQVKLASVVLLVDTLSAYRTSNILVGATEN